MLEIVAILIMALAAFLHYRAGIWGAVLTVFAVLVAGAAAFGFFLPASAAVGGAGFGAMRFWGDALMFLAIFLGAFVVLRLATEQLLKNAMSFFPLINTIGGAVIGLLAGYLAAGIFTVFVQMLPLPPEVLGYEPYKLGSIQRADHLSLKYDEFAVGLYGGLSRNALQIGDATGLAARYPAQDLAKAPDPSRGSTSDDLLYYYFSRRVEFALRNADPLLLYGEDKTRQLSGVRLVNANGSFGAGNASAANRSGPPTQIKIQNAWTSPVLDWTGPDGKRTVITPNQLKWMQPDGSEGEADRDAVFLVVKVAFRSQAKDVVAINLNDWFLDSVFMTQDSGQGHSKRSEPFEIHFPKLLAPAESKTGAAVPNPIAVPAKGNELPFLDTSSVRADNLYVNGKTAPAWAPAAGLKPAGKDALPNALLLASDAAWNFDPEAKNQSDAEATLVFAVPSLTQPFQYGLKCFQKPVVSAPGVHLETGLIPGVIQKLPGFKITVIDVDHKPSLPELGRAKPDHDFMIAKISISRSDAGGAVMNQKDLLLNYEALKDKDKKDNGDFPGQLRLEYETKSGKTERLGRFSNADLLTGQSLTPLPAKSEKTAPTSAVSAASAVAAVKPDGTEIEVFSDWEFYFKAKGASCEVTLIFEVPHGKPAAQYKFKLAEELPSVAPDWYLRKFPKRVTTSTNTIALKSAEVVPSLPLLTGSGKVTQFTVGEEAGAEMAVLTVTVAPKKDDDLSYYQIKVSDFTAMLKMKGLQKPIALFALRLPDEQSFRPRLSLKDDEIMTLHGPTDLAVAIYAVKGYSELQLKVSSFQSLVFANPNAPKEPEPAVTPGPGSVPGTPPGIIRRPGGLRR
jgi:hypothetical protein